MARSKSRAGKSTSKTNSPLWDEILEGASQSGKHLFLCERGRGVRDNKVALGGISESFTTFVNVEMYPRQTSVIDMKKLIVILLIVSSLFTSCRTCSYVSLSQEYADKYVGLSHAQIVDYLGPPSREASDGKGGNILIYENLVAYHQKYKTKTYDTGKSEFYMNFIHLYMTPDGICHKVDTNHEREVCESAPSGGFIALGVVLVAVISFFALR